MDTGDLTFSNCYATDKPHPVPPEFTELAQIVREQLRYALNLPGEWFS